jgi:hypothetical protein
MLATIRGNGQSKQRQQDNGRVTIKYLVAQSVFCVLQLLD